MNWEIAKAKLLAIVAEENSMDNIDNVLARQLEIAKDRQFLKDIIDGSDEDAVIIVISKTDTGIDASFSAHPQFGVSPLELIGILGMVEEDFKDDQRIFMHEMSGGCGNCKTEE